MVVTHLLPISGANPFCHIVLVLRAADCLQQLNYFTLTTMIPFHRGRNGGFALLLCSESAFPENWNVSPIRHFRHLE
jgi:hypothetical protein